MNLRLFIAIELDAGGRQAVEQLVLRLKRTPGRIRWCTPQQYHLTLAFLGSTPAEHVADIAAAMELAAAEVQPFDFELSHFGGFPDLQHPRVLWVGIDEPTGELVRLQKRLADELTGIGFVMEDRVFRPHITVGRVKDLDRRADYDKLFAPLLDFCAPAQYADRMLLISSMLGSDGPAYETVATVGLG